MEKEEILSILTEFGINDFKEKKEIDSSSEDDYRLNIILDKKYVLRINNDVMTEERLSSIDRLIGRYREIGVCAPALIKSKSGSYVFMHDGHACYVSEYIDNPSLEEKVEEVDSSVVFKEVWRSIGRLASKYSGVDLSEVNSMWSLIDLAPLDIDVDEKQENLDMLVEELRKIGEDSFAEEVITFNEDTRARIKRVYKNLPRCVIQGDLNESNILVDNGHFAGLIDFNMAGTEVNINQFCCETNLELSGKDFLSKDAETFYGEWARRQQDALNEILAEYVLNDMEKASIMDYRRICNISMYPNVLDFIEFLNLDKTKTLELIRCIIKN
ncbi:phosphotransferase enzyme family protein [Butyrivibrio sp. MC2021]|uniref:phosphotransferase enzyme family protein n=1 Tax=Butyrivibrio sp. MC2021 TaxID=1408306 RepID=UPI00047D4726|nr:phosphotransferase [Butyrivibrio sp. MC2021]